MKFYDHPDCNGMLSPPKGDETGVMHLPVCRGSYGEPIGVPVTRSYWVPTEEEIEQLKTGRFCIALTIIGVTHAPVRLDVEDAKLELHRQLYMLKNIGPAANDGKPH